MTSWFGRLWAIARMTLLEASRRKAFAILVLFSTSLLIPIAFFPSTEMAGRLKLLEAWALRASTFFTAIVALFITGFLLPSDFEQKRIYMLVSKPVSKSAIFLGRFVGLALLLAIFIVAMGAVTTLFIRGVALLAGPSFPRLVAFERLEANALTTSGEELGGETTKKYVTANGRLIWRYQGLRRSDFGDQIRVETRLTVGAPKDIYRASGNIRLEVVGSSGSPFQRDQFLNTNEEREWLLPADLVGPEGVLNLIVRPMDLDGYVGGPKEGLGLYLKPALFEPVFARGMALVFFQSMIVLALTLMASTFLSAPLSILLGIMLFIVGSAHSYVRDGTRDIDRSLSELQAGPKKQHHHGSEEIPPWFLRFSSVTSKAVLSVVPDFDDFDFSRWLLKDRAVSANELWTAAKHALLPIVALAALGTLVMRFKDFDR